NAACCQLMLGEAGEQGRVIEDLGGQVLYPPFAFFSPGPHARAIHIGHLTSAKRRWDGHYFGRHHIHNGFGQIDSATATDGNISIWLEALCKLRCLLKYILWTMRGRLIKNLYLSLRQ